MLVAAPLAVAAMVLCRCVHPPSGAVALVTVLGGAHVTDAGHTFVLAPVLLNSALLVITALAWNNPTGRSYPHLAHPVVQQQPIRHAAPTLADFETVIADYGEILAVDAADLQMLHEALLCRTANPRH